ncbi:hypothetical protein EXM22_10655 [Oceanispirochaeta crateris]|uniref:Uncharacterized protein n=1 Tax=Oceanispirochaeta crateris TaxID=2518645 RepID=A0A5C1QQM1_9SPIO|nr:hypothetical protein [Oceanispirochaeta crateris]QEN08422.1 hypothetical protein EXM22_10655 [Oceanispirochaeta crateris]
MVDFLTHQVLVYQATVNDKDMEFFHRALYDELNMYIYSFPGYKKSLNEEDWSDFLLGFMGRMHGVLMNFNYRGLSFICYLNKVLSWYLRSFYRQNQKGLDDDWVYVRESIIEYEYNRRCECIPRKYCLLDKMVSIIESSGMTPYRKEALRQRLLLFVLKNISFVEEDDFLTAFPFLGPSAEEALFFRKFLQECLRKKYERKELLSRKRNENYFRLNLTERKKASIADPHLIPGLEKRCNLYRRRLKKLDEQLLSIPLVPSNENIAFLLHLPKGSVDSGLFYLRSYLKDLEESRDCRAFPPD